MKDRFQKGSEKSALSGEIFFLQVSNGDCASTLENEIRELGGKVERFLTKDVTCVVTDRKSRIEPSSSSSSSFKSKFSRASALLQKAQEKNQTTTAHPGGCNVLENARNLGIRVESLDTFAQRLTGLKEKGSNSQTLQQKTTTTHSQLKLLNQHHFLKFEDGEKKFKPQFKTFGQIPPLQVGPSFTGSPFEEIQSSLASSRVESGDVKRAETSDKRPPIKPPKKRSGFCEPCETNYVDMHEHVKSDKHKQFSQNEKNFKRLDELVGELGSADSYSKNLEESESQSTQPPSPSFSHSEGECSSQSKLDPNRDCLPEKRLPNEVIIPPKRGQQNSSSSERPLSKVGLWSEDSSECETKLIKENYIDQILQTLDSDNQKGSLSSRPDSNPNPIKFSILSILQPSSSSSDKKSKLLTKEKECQSKIPVKNQTTNLTKRSDNVGNMTQDHLHQMQLENERVHDSALSESSKILDKEKFKLNGKYVNGFTVQNLLADQDGLEARDPLNILKSSDSQSQGRGRKLKVKNSQQKASSSSAGSQSTLADMVRQSSSISDESHLENKTESSKVQDKKVKQNSKSEIKEIRIPNLAMQELPTDLSKKSKLLEVKPDTADSIENVETEPSISCEPSHSAKEGLVSDAAKVTELPKSECNQQENNLDKKSYVLSMQVDEFETNQPENFEPSHNILDDILQCLKFGSDESESKQRPDIVDDSLDDLPDFLLPTSYPSPKNVPQSKPTSDRPSEFYVENESEPTFNPLPTYLSANLFFPESPKYEDDQPIANQEINKLPLVKKEGETTKSSDHFGLGKKPKEPGKEDDLQIDHLQKSIDGMLKSLKCENKPTDLEKDGKISGVASDALESAQCLSSPKSLNVQDSHSAAYFYHLQQSIDKVLNSLEMDFKHSDEDQRGELDQPKSDKGLLKPDKNFEDNCAIKSSGFQDNRVGTFDDLLSRGKCEDSFPKQLSSPGWANPTTTTSKVEDSADRSTCLMNAYNTFDYFDPSSNAQKMVASFPSLQEESIAGQNDSCGFDYPLIVRKAESESSSDSESSGYDEMKQIEKQLRLFEKEKSKKKESKKSADNVRQTRDEGSNIIIDNPEPSASAQTVSTSSEKPSACSKQKKTKESYTTANTKWKAVSDPNNCLKITLKMCSASSKGDPKSKRTANRELSDDSPRKRLRSSTASSEGLNESNKLSSPIHSPDKNRFASVEKKTVLTTKNSKKKISLYDDSLLSDLGRNQYKVNTKHSTVYSNPCSASKTGGKPSRLLSMMKEDGNKKSELDVYNFSDSDEPSDQPIKSKKRGCKSRAVNRSPRRPRQRKK